MCEGRATVPFIHCSSLGLSACLGGDPQQPRGTRRQWLSALDNPSKVCGVDMCSLGNVMERDCSSPGWTQGGHCLETAVMLFL